MYAYMLGIQIGIRYFMFGRELYIKKGSTSIEYEQDTVFIYLSLYVYANTSTYILCKFETYTDFANGIKV